MGTPCVEERRGTLGLRGGPQGEMAQGPRPIPKELFKGERESGLAGHPRQPSIQAPAFLTLRRGSHPKVTHPILRDEGPSPVCPVSTRENSRREVPTVRQGPRASTVRSLSPKPTIFLSSGGCYGSSPCSPWSLGQWGPVSAEAAGQGVCLCDARRPPHPRVLSQEGTKQGARTGAGVGGGRAPCGPAHRPPSSFLPA